MLAKGMRAGEAFRKGGPEKRVKMVSAEAYEDLFKPILEYPYSDDALYRREGLSMTSDGPRFGFLT